MRKDSPTAVFFPWCRRRLRTVWRCTEVSSHTVFCRRSGTPCCCSCIPSDRWHLPPFLRQQSLLLSQQIYQSEEEVDENMIKISLLLASISRPPSQLPCFCDFFQGKNMEWSLRTMLKFSNSLHQNRVQVVAFQIKGKSLSVGVIGHKWLDSQLWAFIYQSTHFALLHRDVQLSLE